jgi:16S rRNA (cytosine1407-C5)-methyltransferase
VNSIKAREHESIKAVLEEAGFKVRQVPWYKDAFVLLNKSKRELTETSLYKEGKIYIQSLASMVPPLVLGPLPGERVLDLTAAPGSKTSQIAMMMDMTGELHANDNNKVRFFKLKHNMELLGVIESSSRSDASAPEVFDEIEGESEGGEVADDVREEYGGDKKFCTLHLGDGSHFCGEHRDYFDKILVDVPCSAEARFVNGEPKSYGYWSEKKIKEMAYKQRKLLFSAWVALRPGGTLVYSTCTFAPEENEVQVSKLVERFPDEVEMLDCTIDGLKVLKPLRQWKEKPTHPAVQKAARILPTAEIEGFFVAKLRKKKI